MVPHALAPDLHPAGLRAFPFADVLAMVERGEIKDAMTIIAVLRAARLRGL
jgi:hypothetical protein